MSSCSYEQLRLFGQLECEIEAKLDAERRVRRETSCIDCDVWVWGIGELFYLRNEIWLRANPGGKGWLCVGCVETRLGRQLVAGDFEDAHPAGQVNAGPGGSARLRARLKGFRALMRERERISLPALDRDGGARDDREPGEPA